jgi:hypothetical protein
LLLLIAIATGLIAVRYLKTPQGRRIGAIALIFCLTSISGAVISAAQIILDGTGGNWTGVPVLATDPAGDAPYPEIDLLRVYGLYLGNTGQNETLYLKLDIAKKPDNGTTPPVNTPPRITSDPVATGIVGTAYSYQVEAEDDDGDPLTYSLAEAPSGMSISSTGLITWASPVFGSHNITVRVSDGQAQVEQSYTLTISTTPPVNTPPRITSDPVTTGIVGVAYNYQVEAEDDDGDPLTYSLAEAPSGMSISSTGLITWASPILGTHNIIVRVSDGQAQVEQSYTLTISTTPPVNTPPRITSDPVTTGIVGTAYSYQVEAEDDDGDPLTYSLIESPAGMTIDSDGLITWASPALGSHNITVRVSDGQATDNQSYTLTINTAPPVIVVEVSMTEPATGGVFTQSGSISLRASASITGGTISKLEFFNGSTLLGVGVLGGGEYFYTWSAAAGDHNVFARVTDHLSGTHDSPPINIKVCGAPTVVFTSPANGAQTTVPGEWALAATASTVSGCGTITQVEFYNGTQRLHTATSAPYTYHWQNVLTGNHTLTVRATDSLGGVGSDRIHVTVDDGGCVLPKVKLSNPLLGERKQIPAEFVLEAEILTEEACATVEKIGFYANDELLHEAEASPYRYHWQDVPVGVYVLTAKAVDSLGREISSEKAIVSVETNGEPLIAFRNPVDNDIFVAQARIPFELEIDSAGITPHSVEIFATGDIFSRDGAFLRRMDLVPIILMKNSFDKPRYWEDVFPGEYTFIAKVSDPYGEQVLSAPVSVRVISDLEAIPQLAFKQPFPGYVYQEPADIQIKMQVNGGWVRHIDYYGDGDVYIGRATEPPYSITWPQVMQGDSPDGRHTIMAKAETFSGVIVIAESEPFYVRRDVEDISPVKIVSPEAGDVFFQREEYLCSGRRICGMLSRQIEVEIEVDMENISTVARVDFYGDGEFVVEAEFLYEWEGKQRYKTIWTNVEKGSHTLLAHAFGPEGSFYSQTVLIDFKEPFHIEIKKPKQGEYFVSDQTIPLEVETYPRDIEAHEGGVSFHMGYEVILCMPPYELAPHGWGGRHIVCAWAYPKSPYPSAGGLGVFVGNHSYCPSLELGEGEEHAIHCIELNFTEPPPPLLVVYSPVGGTMTTAPVIAVSGQVREPEGARVRINNQTVPLSEDGYFYLEMVRLFLGENEIKVELFSPEGNDSKTIKVTRVPPEEIEVVVDRRFTFTVTPSEGMVPLTTVLEVSSERNAVDLSRYCISAGGGGGTILDTTSSREQIRHTYLLEREGYYVFSVNIRERISYNTPLGEVFLGCGELVYQATRSVMVESPEHMARNGIEIYQDMMERLSKGDDVGALYYFTENAKPRFTEIFVILKDELVEISGNLGELVHGVIGHNVMELMVLRETEQGKELFPVYLIRESDGVWRIDDM